MTTITCPFCHSQVTPPAKKKISSLGILWIILGLFSCFLTLFLLLLPSSWDVVRTCPNCGMNL